jgi:hypothetical protein
MKREDEGGECEFKKLLTKLRLMPCGFGGRKTVGNEEHLHSHPGESLSAGWGITKNRHFLWGRPFKLLSDCRALLWLMNYKGHNHAIIRLQLELLGYWFTIVHRKEHMLAEANYFLRLGQDVHINPLMNDYLSFIQQLRKKYPPSDGEITADNMPGR